MGFWNTIGEAAATFNGDEGAAARFHEKRTAGKRLELQGKSKMIFDDVQHLQDRRAALDPKSPTYAKDVAGIDASLQQHQQAFTDLYHPEKNPGALQHLGGFIKEHLGGRKQRDKERDKDAHGDLYGPKIPSTPGEAKARMADLQASAAGPGQTPSAPPAFNPYEVKIKNLEAVGVPHDEAVRIATGQKTPKPGTTTPKGTAPPDKPIHQTADERTRADFAEWKKDHPEYKKTFEDWRYERSHPAKPAKPVGPVHLTPAQNSAQKDYLAADKLSRTADMVAQHPDDAVNQKRLAVALERISAGRFTTQALDYIIKAGWGNTLQQWANNPSTGALPPDIMRQLVDGAHENLEAAQSELDEADQLAPKPPATPREAKDRMKPQAAKPSGKAVSLAEAKKLPAMKGKTDAEITAAIKAAGHEVKP